MISEPSIPWPKKLMMKSMSDTILSPRRKTICWKRKPHLWRLSKKLTIVAYQWEDQSLRKTNLINEDNPQLDFATGNPDISAGTNWDSQAGFYGRVNYMFNDKYLFEGVLRRDATSKFPAHLRWKTYPGVSAGWVVSNESFMESVSSVLSFAKLRASWGSIGDQSVSNSLYVPTMGKPTQNAW